MRKWFGLSCTWLYTLPYELSVCMSLSGRADLVGRRNESVVILFGGRHDAIDGAYRRWSSLAHRTTSRSIENIEILAYIYILYYIISVCRNSFRYTSRSGRINCSAVVAPCGVHHFINKTKPIRKYMCYNM